MPSASVYAFGSFRLDVEQRVLFNGDQPLPLRPRDIDTLLVLVENSGRVVTREQLISAVWGSMVVEEGNLSRHIFNLRQILGEDEHLRYIETVPKRGYRFAASVERMGTKQGRRHDDASPNARKMLLVLPIANLTGSEEHEYLIDGFTETLIAQLGQLDPRHLGVIARTSAMTYKATRKTIAEIAGELGIQYALEGSVRQSGDALTINVQLIRAADQCVVVAKHYAQPRNEALTLNDVIAEAIAHEVRIRIRTAPVTSTSASPIHPDAHDQYLRGRYFWGIRSPDAVTQAIAHFENALQIEPQYALAHSGLSVCWAFRSLYSGLPPSTTFPIAKAAAQRALQLDNGISEAHSILGICLAMFDYEWTASEDELRRAIELDPNSSVAHHWYALFLGFMARAEEGLRQADVALSLDPHSPAIRMNHGLLHDFCGRKFLCIDTYEKIVAQHPNFHICRIMLGANLCKVGKADAGIEHLKIAHEHSGKQPDGLAHLGLGYATIGQPDKAREMLAAIHSNGGPASAYYIARIHAVLGEFDLAFEYLDRAYREHSILIMAIRSDFWLEPLHSDTRYGALIKRMRFPHV